MQTYKIKYGLRNLKKDYDLGCFFSKEIQGKTFAEAVSMFKCLSEIEDWEVYNVSELKG